MRAQLRHRVVFALQFFFRQQTMNLIVTGAANARHLSHSGPVEFALIALVVMTSPRNKMMPGQSFFAIADRATTLHT